MTWVRRTTSVEATKEAGEQLAEILRPGDIILLTGQLGAGKTALTQGVARGLGVTERVTSPTFTLVRQHECHSSNGITTLHHADVYRTNSLDEIEDLSLDELVASSGVAIIEWGEMAEPLLGRHAWRITVNVIDDDVRDIVVDETTLGERATLVREWTER